MRNSLLRVVILNSVNKISGTLCSQKSVLMLNVPPIKSFVRFVAASSNLYDVLGVKQNATSEDIRSAFLKLSKVYHPDLNQKDPGNHAKFVRINEAYSILGKPLTRHEYDIKLSLDNLSYKATHADKSNTHRKQKMNVDEFEHFDDPYLQYARNAQKFSHQGRNRTKTNSSALICCLLLFVGPILWLLSMKFNPDNRDLYTSRRGLSHGYLGETPASNVQADEQLPKR